jgi:hypothetical protein
MKVDNLQDEFDATPESRSIDSYNHELMGVKGRKL